MICCNIDDSELPESQRISTYIRKSKIVEIDGRRIGIIGYVTPETKVNFFSTDSSLKETVNCYLGRQKTNS